MAEREFKRLNSRKLKSLTREEVIKYYDQLRSFYLSLPYNEAEKQRKAQHYLHIGKILIPITDWLYHPTPINNESHIDRIDNKGFIYISNHLNSLDQFSLISAIGKDKPLVVLAKNTLLNLKRRWLYKYVGCEFIDLNNLRTVKTVFETLAKDILHGRDVLIFPEGTRNTTEKLMLNFQMGAVMLAQETGTKIIPYAINEDYRILRHCHLYVRRGGEFTVSPYDDLAEANERLENAVRTLIWDNMELERNTRTHTLNEEIKNDAMKRYYKKRTKLEKQRNRINTKNT